MISFDGIELDAKIKYDVELNAEWDINILKDTFNVNFNGNRPSIKNQNDKLYFYYTFVDEFVNYVELDYDVLKNDVNNLNIYDDFLNHISKQIVKNKTAYDKFIIDQFNIIEFVKHKLNSESLLSSDIFLSIHKRYDNTLDGNVLCSTLLDKMLTYVPERFSRMRLNNVVSLPFKENDFFFKMITLEYIGIKRVYLIKIHIRKINK
jgi:hypothetical protein